MTPILYRLKEPSTWAGLSALLVVLGLSSGLADAVVNAVAALTGLLAVALPETGRNL